MWTTGPGRSKSIRAPGRGMEMVRILEDTRLATKVGADVEEEALLSRVALRKW